MRFKVVRADDFCTGFWSIEDAETRSFERRRRYSELLATRRGRLVVEGDDLVSRNRADSALVSIGIVQEDVSLCFDLLKTLSEKFDARVYIAGCADANPQENEVAVRIFQRRGEITASYSDQKMSDLVLWLIEQSRELREMASAANFSYVELGTHTFFRDVNAAAERIATSAGRH